MVGVSGLFSLVSCGSGAESPTNSQNYGEVVSLSKQNIITIPKGTVVSGVPLPINLPLSSPVATGLLTALVGGYNILDGGASNAGLSNVGSTTDLYNYDPVSQLLGPLLMENSSNDYVESVSAYAVEYKTPGQNADTTPSQIVRTASGLIIVPNMKAGQKIKGVVVYFHPTTVGKNQVPSCLGSPGFGLPNISTNVPEYCNLTALDGTGVGLYANLSAIFADNGYVVIAPDYVGQGSDWQNVHPFVAYPEVNVLSAFNMFGATRQILANDYAIPSTESLPLFITGYSEGGGYALKASQMAQTSQSVMLTKNALELKMTSPQEGAYSLQDQMDFAFSEAYDGVFNCATESCGQIDLASESSYLESVNVWGIGSAYYVAQAKPYLTSYVLTAVNYYNFHNLTSAYDFTMNKQFWSQIPIESKIASLYQLYSAESGYIFPGNEISSAIVKNTIGLNKYDYLAQPKVNLYTQVPQVPLVPVTLAETIPGGIPFGNNNIGSNYMNPGIQTNPQFAEVILDGNTYNWQTLSPINFIHLRNDSVVTLVNSKQAISCMTTGKSFAGDKSTPKASAGVCSTSPSGKYLIGSTEIPNYQITNNLAQMTPGDPAATSQFFVNPESSSNISGYVFVQTMNGVLAKIDPDADKTATPFDHGDMFVLGNIIALCNFENMLESNKISSMCPSQYNPQD